MKIIVGAALSLPPYAPGKVWHRLHYILGLQQLGHEVYFLEELKPEWCVDVYGRPCDVERSVNRYLFQTTMERFGLLASACQIYNQGEATFGLSRRALITLSKEADVLINWTGHIETDFILSNVKRRVYLDLDPVYTQLWQAEYGVDLNFGAHDIFLSVGLNIGTPYTSIPDCGVEWHHTLPPVILEYWPFHIDLSCKRFTTIASAVAYGDLCYQGEQYGSKQQEFERFAALPSRSGQEFEIALKDYHAKEASLQGLKDNGWLFLDASQIADLSGYQHYIARSQAEIGFAQNAYVQGRSGWFSDRWSHYLASGKPVLAQSTGFERWVPVGRGLFSFSSLEEAVEGVSRINQDYRAHCQAAREFAEAYLDHRKVLPKMLEVCTAH
jgi:hypothetical protein